MRTHLFILSAALSLLFNSVSAQADFNPHVTVELLSEKEAVASNTEQYLGLWFKPEPGWHVFWENPGDAGLPMRVEWEKSSDAFSIGSLLFPTPSLVPYGGLVNFGYDGDVLILAKLKLGELKGFLSRFKSHEEIKVIAHARWLVCKDECIPGKATLELKLPIVSGETYAEVTGTHSDLFKKTISSLPSTEFDRRLSITQDETNQVKINVTPFLVGKSWSILKKNIFFYPKKNIGMNVLSIEPSTPQRGLEEKGQFFWSFKSKEKLDQLEGVLQVGTQGYLIQKSFNESSHEGKVQGDLASDDHVSPHLSFDQYFFLMLGFAFLGGLVLNLMPCILPVLSIKVLDLINQSGEEKKRIRKHGLAFTLGVLSSFWILAAILLILRAGGNQLGWGFQLQSPIFISVLILMFTLFGLNLMGAFEIGTRLMGVGGRLKINQGYLGSFFTGVLTTVAATPCSAPFMGTALGFALTQNAVIVVSVLTFLAFGLSFPFLLFSFYPRASKVLPKPGKWMLTFKQFLALPLFATAIWLLSVLSNQSGTVGVTSALVAVLLVYTTIWLYQLEVKKKSYQLVRWVFILLSLSVSIQQLAGIQMVHRNENQVSDRLKKPWIPFNEVELNRALGEGKTVFVNFTADWCVTCKVNERLVFNQKEVIQKLESDHVIAMMGDWTNGDPKITEFMARFNRNSVPVYLLFRNGQAKPEVLPQILTVRGFVGKL